ncbi:MAG: SAVED domain-containing protein [Anaerolineae bacterium]|nr:SAVED domain-containing protein [Anaerolineae bacterium]
MISRFVLPKPVSDDSHIFEDLVCEVMVRQLNCRNLQRYGRDGQKQHGVDIAGVTPHGIVGIQCKHHPTTIITTAEIDKEISKSEKFRPELVELFIVTSSDRDTKAHSHVLKCTRQRQERGHYPVIIVFWDELVNWLDGYPDLIYKYFSQFFPSSELENIHIPSSNTEAGRTTMRWRVQPQELKNAISQSFHDIPMVTPYQVTIGLTSFPDTQFDGLTDLEMQLSYLFDDEVNTEENFVNAALELHELQKLLNDSFYSREVWVYLNARLSLAFLLGWIFRRVTGFSLKLIANEQGWTTTGLPTVATGLTDDLPIVLNPSSSEVAVVLNISRDTGNGVYDYVKTWQDLPYAVLIWNLDTRIVRSAAHALSLAQEISQKLKALMDRGNVSHIHLFGAVPASLAALIGYHLNAIRPITIYFLDSSRQQYLRGGTLHNSL